MCIILTHLPYLSTLIPYTTLFRSAVLVRVQAAHDVDEGARGQLLAQPGALLRQESVILLIAAPRGEILPGVRDVQVAQQQELATGRRGRAAGPGEEIGRASCRGGGSRAGGRGRRGG